ncbi:MAG: prepilin-type N-terminal cleavage/methylation domain-containing protein [Deltaproteobacteria bacterium]|nr:prepilin-type N-terminal cleavage/methylation domain-containing protein [Deltaproteobacteria bacterium]
MCPRPLRKPRLLRRAMTLVEVMVAISVLSVLGVMAWQSIASTVQARDILDAEDELQQSARGPCSASPAACSSAYLTSNLQTVNTYVTRFATRRQPVDTLWFTSLAHQRLYRNTRESDHTEFTIWGEPDPNRRGAQVLLMREAQRIDHLTDKDGPILPLAYGVKSFQVRSLNSTTCEWQDDWDDRSIESGQTNALPRAVQIVLIMLMDDPVEEDVTLERAFATTVILEYGKRAECVPGTAQ